MSRRERPEEVDPEDVALFADLAERERGEQREERERGVREERREERPAAAAKVGPLTAAGVTFDEAGRLRIETIEHAQAVAMHLIQRGMVPRGLEDPGRLLIVFEISRQLGIPWVQGLQGVWVNDGRASIFGDLGRALVTRSGELTGNWEGLRGDGDQLEAWCRLTRKGVEGCFEGSFSVDDAKLAGLWGRATWRKHPKDMLAWRAWWRAAKRGFADTFKGVVIREVMDDYDDSPRVPEHEVRTVDQILAPLVQRRED